MFLLWEKTGVLRGNIHNNNENVQATCRCCPSNGPQSCTATGLTTEPGVTLDTATARDTFTVDVPKLFQPTHRFLIWGTGNVIYNTHSEYRIESSTFPIPCFFEVRTGTEVSREWNYLIRVSPMMT